MFLWLACTTAPVPEPAPVEQALPPVPEAPVPVPAPPAKPAPPPPLIHAVPDGFVDLRTIKGVSIEPRYHTTDNFTGAPLPGYGARAMWLEERAAAALKRAATAAASEGLGLRVYDAYRPYRATQAMVAWTERTGKQHLIAQGYIASKSTHNTGGTVDITLTRDGQPLDMGTPWDSFSTDSHTVNAEGEALANRQLLARLMTEAGFKPYSKEWWHFSYPERGRSRDVPYGCFEAPEGRWTAPRGWTESSYRAPSEWTATSCSP